MAMAGALVAIVERRDRSSTNRPTTFETPTSDEVFGDTVGIVASDDRFDFLETSFRKWVGGEEFRLAAPLAGLLENPHDVEHGRRVITRLSHILESELVGLRLVFSAESELGHLVDQRG